MKADWKYDLIKFVIGNIQYVVRTILFGILTQYCPMCHDSTGALCDNIDGIVAVAA